MLNAQTLSNRVAALLLPEAVACKETTSRTYRQPLTLVVNYIHENVDSELDVNTLADVAMMSPYPFHRTSCSGYHLDKVLLNK